MAPKVETFSAASIPAQLLTRLNSHLPFSLTVLRRLQVASRKQGGSTPNSHILYVHDGSYTDGPFAAAYMDLSRGPETECWIYSSLQDSVPPNPSPTSSEVLLPTGLSPDEQEVCVRQVLFLLRRIRAIETSYAFAHGEEGFNKGHSKGHVRIGALHETVRQLLIAAGVKVKATSVVPVGKEWEFYATWLIRVEDLKVENEVDLPTGMRWDVLREGDTDLVKGRTNIPKRDDTMLMVPSTVIRAEDGTAVAWGYLGVDGSVSTLHVEEPYRGRGLAKALTGRLLRERLQELGDDGWCSTDISTTNLQSQGVFKSIGGKPAWTVSWMYLDLATVGEPL